MVHKNSRIIQGFLPVLALKPDGSERQQGSKPAPAKHGRYAANVASVRPRLGTCNGNSATALCNLRQRDPRYQGWQVARTPVR